MFFQALRLIRQLLARENDPPCDLIVQYDFVPYICSFIASQDEEVLKEALWCLTNIVSGKAEYTKIVVECGVVPPIVRLLEYNTPLVKELTAWAIGNIAGDGIAYRNFLLENNAIHLLLNNLKSCPNPNVQKVSAWSLSNLVRGKPCPINYLDDILPVISHLLNSEIEEVVCDALWTLSYITDVEETDNDRIDKIINFGIVPKIVSQIFSNYNAQTPAIRIVGNICSGSKSQTQEVLKTNFLELAPNLLKDDRRIIRKETAWTLSNIAAGSRKQIQNIIDQDLVTTIINGLSDNEHEVVRECCYCLFNLVEGSNYDQFITVMEEKSLECLVELFEYPDAKVVKVVLQTIESILIRGQKYEERLHESNPFVAALESYETALAQLEELQSHKNDEIYELASHILETFFGAKVDDVDITDDLMNDTFDTTQKTTITF